MGHFTTRSWFVFGLALAVLFLIPLWAAVGVFAQAEGEGGHGSMAMDMAGMGEMGEIAKARAQFIGNVEAYTVGNQRNDGCVGPDRTPAGAGMQDMQGTHAGQAGEQAGSEQHEEEAPAAVVYLQAKQWVFVPKELCLQTGETYEFRMMSTDVTHGGSAQLGLGSTMVRLPPGVEVVKRITFTEPGQYLLYCSFYCGPGHQIMAGRITVVPGAPSEAGQPNQSGAPVGGDHGSGKGH